METITINGTEYQLDIEKAEKQGVLKKKEIKPRSWREYETAWVNPDDNVKYASDYNTNDSLTYDIFNSEEEARAFCALGKLIQLRDAWVGDWKPNWEKSNTKYGICNYQNEIDTLEGDFVACLLAFPTEEMCKDFLETFRDLIEQAKMFL